MRTFVVSFLAVAVALTGCGDDSAPAEDAGVGRTDAALQEGGVVPDDAGAATDAGAFDAGATDAGLAACVSGDCDPRDVAACADSDARVCVLSDRVPSCQPSAGEGAEGASCVSEDDCAATLACFRNGSDGVCARVCCPGEIGACGDELDGASYCRADGVLATGIATSWGRCSVVQTCDVLAPAVACAAGEGCYVETETMRSVCRYAGSGDVGSRCERQTDCGAGFFCGGVPTSTCVRICRLDDAGSCPEIEGRCVAQAYSPPGSGVCVATSTPRPR